MLTKHSFSLEFPGAEILGTLLQTFVFQVFGVASLIHIWQSLDMSFLPRTTLRGFVWKYIPCFQTFLHGNRQFYWEYEYTVPQLDVWITAGVAQVMEVPWACLLLPETCRCVPQKNANLKVDWWYYSNPQKTGKQKLDSDIWVTYSCRFWRPSHHCSCYTHVPRAAEPILRQLEANFLS